MWPRPRPMGTSSTAPRRAARAPSRTAWLIDRRDRVRAWWRAIDWNARSDRRAVYVLAVLMVLTGLFLMYMGHGETFFYDDWSFVVHKIGSGFHAYLLPHNEHFSLVPIAIYKLLFALVGLNHYPIFRLVLVVFHLICVALVYDLVSRRVGAWPALILAVLMLCLFAAWQNLIWAFQMSFVGSVMGGLAAWALLDRDTLACDIAAAVALAFSLACSGLGLPFVPALAAEFAWQRRWWRLWVVAVPFALFLVWYSQYGVTMVSANKMAHAPQWIFDMAAAGAGVLIGRDTDWGIPLMVLLLALGAWRFVAGARISPRLLGAAVAALTFWILTGISRSTVDLPDESRYAYLSAAFLLIVAVELMPVVRYSGRGIALGVAVAVAAALMGAQTLHTNALTLRIDSQTIAAQLGALQLESAHVGPTYSPNPSLAPDITAGPYLRAVRKTHSSPAQSVAQILADSEAVRQSADIVLVQSIAASPRPTVAVPSGPPPIVDAATSVGVVPAGSCLNVSPLPGTSLIDITVPAGGVLIRDTGRTQVIPALRRFADTFTPLIGHVYPGQSLGVVLPPDAAPTLPWHLQISVYGTMSLCTLPPG